MVSAKPKRQARNLLLLGSYLSGGENNEPSRFLFHLIPCSQLHVRLCDVFYFHIVDAPVTGSDLIWGTFTAVTFWRDKALASTVSSWQFSLDGNPGHKDEF